MRSPKGANSQSEAFELAVRKVGLPDCIVVLINLALCLFLFIFDFIEVTPSRK